jgi:hypothetical protein
LGTLGRIWSATRRHCCLAVSALIVHTNTVENVFSIRYNRRSALGIEDGERTEDALRTIRAYITNFL